jgi:hypothetical protein
MNGPRSLPQHLPACDTSPRSFHRLVTAGQLRLTFRVRACSRTGARAGSLFFFLRLLLRRFRCFRERTWPPGSGAPDALVRGSRPVQSVELPPRFALAGRTRRPSLHGSVGLPFRTCSSLMVQSISLLPCGHLISHPGNPPLPPLSPNRHRSSSLVRFPRSGGEPLAYFSVTRTRRGN